MPGLLNTIFISALMMLKIYVGQDSHEIGEEGLLHSFYSTIAVRLELPPGDLVWDIDNRDAVAPFAEALHHDVGTLDNCFMTVEYKSLLKVLRQMLDQSRRMHEPVYIQTAY